VRNFYLHSLGEKKAVKAIMHFLLNTKHTTLIVHSPQEMIYFGSLTNNKLYFLPYCEDPIFEMDDSQAPEGDYVFTGGYSNRDYLLLLKCAQNNPTVKFVVAVSRLNKDISGKQIPENITIFEEVDALKFNGLMYKSAGVIIPLKENVGSSGQMLCLGALKMAKAIIYCNISSINYYFDNESSGIPYAIGDIESLNKAVRKLFSEEFDRKALGQAARTHYIENFTLEKSNEQLLDILVSNNFH
jgi:glycosyltransferase involved in cell wall biosynthesis